MQNLKKYILFFSVCIIAACEKEIDLKVPNPKDAYVVEGHIENGIPPYVLLTKNAAFYGNINLSNLANYFVSGANMTVISGNDTIPLVEYNGAILQSLPDSVAIPLAAQFGLNISSASEFPQIIIYSLFSLILCGCDHIRMQHWQILFIRCMADCRIRPLQERSTAILPKQIMKPF